jgi:hypothetical protein
MKGSNRATLKAIIILKLKNCEAQVEISDRNNQNLPPKMPIYGEVIIKLGSYNLLLHFNFNIITI